MKPKEWYFHFVFATCLLLRAIAALATTFTRRTCIAFALVFGFTLSSHATTHFVDSNGASPTAPYLDWTTAATNIQDAVDASVDGDLVLVTNGVYASGGRPVNGFALTNRVAIDRAITVQSVNGPAATAILGNPVTGDTAVRCAYMTNGATLNGFTLAYGATRDANGIDVFERNGGGAYCETNTAFLSNCVLATNSASDSGGAIYQGTLNNCTLVGNQATGNGGAAESSTLTNCSVTANNAYYGGGADASSLANCLVTANQGAYGGGAMNTLLHLCFVESNSGLNWAGGAYNCTLDNCLVASNTAGTQGGGAVYCTMNNCTVVANSAPTGGGDYQGWLTNCIIYNNSGSAGVSNYWGSQMNFCCTAPVPSLGGGFIIPSAPLFVNLSAGDYHLQPSSPCINVGNNAFIVGNSDLDGNPRIVANTVDIGAYEYPSPVPLSVVIQPNATNIATGFPLGFQAVIQGGSPDSSFWNFGDGTFISNQLAPSHTWTSPGLYNVTVTVSNAFTPGGATASVTIQVVSNPVFYVNANGANPTPPYSSWDTAATNIQDAIDASFDGSLILVSNGVYATGGRTVGIFGLTNRVVVNKVVTVQSVNGPAVTTILGHRPATTNGLNAVRCVWLTNNASLIGFTLVGGATLPGGDFVNEMSGGGILCNTNNVTVSNCVVISNACASAGGGVYLGTLFNCVIKNNLSTSGGGGTAYSALWSCIVSRNQATTTGGGCSGGFLSNCVVSGNSAHTTSLFGTPSGGGVASATVINSLISGNSAINGGGVYLGTVINSAVWNNSATTAGGIYQANATNSTIIGNTASSVAGGLYLSSAVNSIVYFNTSKAANFNNYEATIQQTLDHCCTLPMPSTANGTGNITNDPTLASVSHISLNSPCRGAGNPAATAGTDIDGEPWANPPSIGCDELYPGTLTNTPIIAITATYTNVPVGYSNNFAANITGQVNGSIWDFGDGTRATNIPVISHIWPAAGIYPVTLYAFNDAYPSGLSTVLTINYYIPQTLYVMTSSTTPIAPYDSWSKAATNIQNAIDVAYTNDVIIVSNGFYNTGSRTNTDGTTNRIFVWQPVTLQSLNGSAVTRIDGGNTMRCVFLTNGAGLSGFTITNGFSPNGGGIFSTSSNNLVSSCLIISNRASGNGGGLYQGTATNCTFKLNSGSAAFGSVLQSCVVGPWNSGSFAAIQNCLVSNSIVSSNRAGVNSSTVFNSIISSNIPGGGASGSVLVNCIISSNAALSTAGVGNCFATNCVIFGNVSVDAGAGGAAFSTLVNCTVVSNSGVTGGVSFGFVSNCIVYYNTLRGTNTPSNLNNTPNNCCTFPLPSVGIGNFTNPPLFVNLAGGDFHLQSTSPCINAGNNTAVTTATDFDGNPRVVGGTVDVGAYEYQTPTSILSYAWAQQYGIPTDGTADFADPDGDGMNNWQEWIAGTVPTNALSSLLLLSPNFTNSAGVTVTWQSVTNQTYYLQRATDLGASPAFTSIQSNIVGQTGFTIFLDTTATNSNAYFYRVGIQQPYLNPFN
jgi:predicted outer membrane repeat protein